MLKALALAGLSVLAFAVRGAALSQEKAPPAAVVKVVLENDKVKVQEVRLAPGAVSRMQARPGRVLHFFTAARFRLTYPDGRTEEVTHGAGETVWRDPVAYEATNVGKNEIRLLAVLPK